MGIEGWFFNHLDGNVIITVLAVLVLAWRTKNAQVGILSAALNTALTSIQTMSRRLDEMEVLRDKDRHDHETERQKWEKRINDMGAALLKTKRELGQTIERQSGELIQLRGQLAREGDERKRLKDCIDQLEANNTTLQGRVLALEGENVRLKGERDSLTVEVAALRRKVEAINQQALSEKVEAGETASRPGEPEEKEQI